MSHNASPLHQSYAPSAANSDNLVDLLADVSQHGSSLFELFSFPYNAPHSAHPPSDEPCKLSSLSPQAVAQAAARAAAQAAAAQVAASQALHGHVISPLQTVPQPTPFGFTSSANTLSAFPNEESSLPLTSAQLPPVLPFSSPAQVGKLSIPKRNSSTASLPKSKRRASASQRSTVSPKAPKTLIAKRPQKNATAPLTAICPRPPTLSATPNDESEASDRSDEDPHSSSTKHPPPGAANPKRPTRKASTPASTSKSNPSNTESSAGLEPPVKHSHNSHTRRCRAKVNSKFQELLGVLPAPPPNAGIKHKAQILDYTIRVFRDIHARKTLLEAELALSSRTHLKAWVDNIVARSKSLQDILTPYLSLICTKGNWKYSEAWVNSQDGYLNNVGNSATKASTTEMMSAVHAMSGGNIFLQGGINKWAVGVNSRLRLGLAFIPSLGNTDDPDLQSKLERFRDKSRPYGCKARVDLPGRILCTMRPEWLPSLEDTEAFQRSRLAGDASLVMCFGVPVFVGGQVAAVAMFFDTEQRPYDAMCVDLADNVASLLGSTFGNMLQAPGRVMPPSVGEVRLEHVGGPHLIANGI